MIAAALLACSVVSVHDGDTLTCAGLGRIRLLGIDAAEMGACPSYRQCAPGDPVAQRDALRRFVSKGNVTVEPVTRDKYGRIVGIVRVNGKSASCAMLQAGAMYMPKWDNGRRVARECGL